VSALESQQREKVKGFCITMKCFWPHQLIWRGVSGPQWDPLPEAESGMKSAPVHKCWQPCLGEKHDAPASFSYSTQPWNGIASSYRRLKLDLHPEHNRSWLSQ
jgi:hypothetical protein